MQRIFKYGEIQNTHFAFNKELNIFIYQTPSYVIIYRSYILSNMVRFFRPNLYLQCFVTHSAHIRNQRRVSLNSIVVVSNI